MEIIKGFDEGLYKTIARASGNRQAVRDVEYMRMSHFREPSKTYCERIGNASIIMAKTLKGKMRIIGMATREEDKGNGYATLLLGRLEEYCRKNGFPLMVTITTAGKTFYEQFGFKALEMREGGGYGWKNNCKALFLNWSKRIKARDGRGR